MISADDLVRTLGVDFAAQPSNTAACLIRWSDGQAVVERLERNVDDDWLVALADQADKVGLDIPFGWPIDFVSAISAHQEHLGSARTSRACFGQRRGFRSRPNTSRCAAITRTALMRSSLP
jgi:hypothetical protein